MPSRRFKLNPSPHFPNKNQKKNQSIHQITTQKGDETNQNNSTTPPIINPKTELKNKNPERFWCT